jgi:hypothetical protein
MRALRIAAVLMAALQGVGTGASAQGKSEQKRQVTVYLSDSITVPAIVKAQAKAIASDMFAGIGVAMHWKSGRPSPSETEAIAIELVTDTPETYQPGAWAFALPYEGVHIRIFWDRIKADPLARQLLAHVMVHEITHILQGVAQHSAEGVMKARWSDQDRRAMARSPLHFPPDDVEMIYQRMETRGIHAPKRAVQKLTSTTVEVAAQ